MPDGLHLYTVNGKPRTISIPGKLWRCVVRINCPVSWNREAAALISSVRNDYWKLFRKTLCSALSSRNAALVHAGSGASSQSLSQLMGDNLPWQTETWFEPMTPGDRHESEILEHQTRLMREFGRGSRFVIIFDHEPAITLTAGRLVQSATPEQQKQIQVPQPLSHFQAMLFFFDLEARLVGIESFTPDATVPPDSVGMGAR